MFGNSQRWEDPRINKNIFKELWSERKEQNIWIWLAFGIISLFAVGSLALVIVRMVLFYSPNDTSSYFYQYFLGLGQAAINSGAVTTTSSASIVAANYMNFYLNRQIIPTIVMFVLTLTAIGFFIFKYLKARDYKSYHLLSSGSVSAVSFINIAILITTIVSMNYFNTPIDIAQICFNVVFIFAIFVVGRRYNYIIRLYQRVYFNDMQRIMAEELRKSMAANGGFNPFQGFNGMANPFVTNPSDETPQAQVVEDDSELNESKATKEKAPEMSQYEKDFLTVSNLSRDQLNKMADELEIFGYQEMSDLELARKIVDLTTENAKNN